MYTASATHYYILPKASTRPTLSYKNHMMK